MPWVRLSWWVSFRHLILDTPTESSNELYCVLLSSTVFYCTLLLCTTYVQPTYNLRAIHVQPTYSLRTTYVQPSYSLRTTYVQPTYNLRTTYSYVQPTHNLQLCTTYVRPTYNLRATYVQLCSTVFYCALLRQSSEAPHKTARQHTPREVQWAKALECNLSVHLKEDPRRVSSVHFIIYNL